LTTVHTHSSLSLGNAFKFSFWRAFFCVLGALPSFGYLPFFRVFGLLYNTQKEFLTNTKWLLICMRIGGGGVAGWRNVLYTLWGPGWGLVRYSVSSHPFAESSIAILLPMLLCCCVALLLLLLG